MENGNLRDLLLTSYSGDSENDNNGLRHPMVFAKEVADAIDFLHDNEVILRMKCSAHKLLLFSHVTVHAMRDWFSFQTRELDGLINILNYYDHKLKVK